MQKVTHDNYRKDILPFLQGRAEPQQFVMDQMWLIHGSHGIQYEIKKDFLYLYKKKKIINNQVFYLICPPLSPDQNHPAEKVAFLAALDQCPGVVSSEDISRFRDMKTIIQGEFQVKEKYTEYICQTGAYPDKLTGKTWKQWRRSINTIDEYYELRAHNPKDEYVSTTISKACRAIGKVWAEEHRADGGKVHPYIYAWVDSLNLIEGATLFTLTDPKTGVFIGYSIIHYPGGSTAFYSDEKYLEDEKPNFPLLKGIHYKIMRYLQVKYQKDLYVNIGLAASPGIRQSKESLRASTLLDIYQVKANPKEVKQ